MPFAPKSHRPFVGKPRRLPDERPNAHRRGYGRDWQKFRAEIAAARPAICVVCGAALASSKMHLDHILPKADGGQDVAENVQWLCKEHHDEKTKRETVSRRKGR